MNYYNEFDPFAAEWLKSLIKNGLIPDGEVDTRSIVDVSTDDLREFRQCHFFTGICGWSHALNLAQWPADREIWTGSCPCQPFLVAGKGKGESDERHLWPHFFRLISACRPPIVMGEQVAGKAGYGWFDGVRSDLEREGYASRAVDIPACSVNAPHIRQRLYWVANRAVDNTMRRRHESENQEVFSGRDGSVDAGRIYDMADAMRSEWGPLTERRRHDDHRSNAGREEASSGHNICCPWDGAEWLTGADGKTRRAKPGVRLLVDGVPNRVGRLRGYGNAIVPPLAAEVIKSFMEVYLEQSRTQAKDW